MLAPADHLLVLVILLGLPLRAFGSMRALQLAPREALPGLRRRIWVRALLSQWLLVTLVVVLIVKLGRDPGAMLLVPRPTLGMLGVLVGLATIVSLAMRQRAAVDSDPEMRRRVRERLGSVARLMPASRAEYPLFAALACTAGICEEILFRSYLFWYSAHFMPELAAAAVQATLFGVAHFYQGPRGIALTGFVGVFLTGVALVSGSIWPAVVIHALMDLNAGDLALRAGLGEDGPPGPA